MKIRYLAPMFLLAACSNQPQENLVLQQAPSEPKTVVVKEPIYVIEPAPEPNKLRKEKFVDPKTATRNASKKSIFMPKPENFIGSTLEYPIVDGYLYRVLTQQNEITAIELPPGCKFHAKSPYVGDNSTYKESPEAGEEPNWEVVKSAHGGNDGPVAKVLVRPRISGLKTTLQADTDCGAFRYKLEATTASANETVRFRKELSQMGFPESPVASEDEPKNKAPVYGCDNMPVSMATFAYKVSGDSSVWAPRKDQIFHNGKKDGGKTCVKLSDALAADEYPTPYLISAGEESTIYNRITPGGYMEFDKVLPFLALRLNEETVKITLQR